MELEAMELEAMDRGSTGRAAASVPGCSEGLAELDDVIRLANLQNFDLYVFLRVLDEEGLSPLAVKIDYSPTGGAFGLPIRYELSKPMKALRAALWARQRHTDEAEGAAVHEALQSEAPDGETEFTDQDYAWAEERLRARFGPEVQIVHASRSERSHAPDPPPET